MARAAGLVRALLALPDLRLRAAWLRERVERLPSEVAARELNTLCEASERSDPEAREALLAVAAMLCALGEQPLLEALRSEAIEQRLLGLDRLVRRAPPPLVADRPHRELPVPDYGVGRELTVGERKSLARRPNRRAFDRLLRDPHPLVIRQLLENPKLTEDDVVRIAARRPARLEALHELSQHPIWLSRRRVRLALLHNPGTPAALALPLCGLCTRLELRELVENTESTTVMRVVAKELLDRRPPLVEPDLAELVLQ